MTDVVLKAFRACAASQGDTNNLTFGFGGTNSSSADGAEIKGFGYYETVAGGSGAGPTWKGTSGVHTHMTNTRITDAEVFERRYPVVLREFGLRQGSAGRGMHPGGEGVVRDIEFRIPVQVSILSERRVYHPYGMAGGGDAACGMNLWARRVHRTEPARDDSEVEYQYVSLGAKNTASMQPGERIIVSSPGGGGWGPEGDEAREEQKQDALRAWRQGSVAQRMAMAEASA